LRFLLIEKGCEIVNLQPSSTSPSIRQVGGI
jgi:hypothetical protein